MPQSSRFRARAHRADLPEPRPRAWDRASDIVPTAYGLRIARRLLKKAYARKSSGLTERYMYSIRSGIPHSGETGPDGATVLDVFSPVRSDWYDTPRLDVAKGRWP